MAQFIKAEDGRFLNVDHIYEFVPAWGRGGSYVARCAGTDEYGDPASTEVDATIVRRLVAAKSAPSKSQ